MGAAVVEVINSVLEAKGEPRRPATAPGVRVRRPSLGGPRPPVDSRAGEMAKQMFQAWPEFESKHVQLVGKTWRQQLRQTRIAAETAVRGAGEVDIQTAELDKERAAYQRRAEMKKRYRDTIRAEYNAREERLTSELYEAESELEA